MNTKNVVAAIVLGASGVWFGCALSACGQATDPQPTESTASNDDALTGVLGCQQQVLECQADAQALPPSKACQDQLRSCLMALVPDAGFTLPTPPTLPTRPGRDAGLPSLPTPPVRDAGPITLPTPPALPDAGVPADAQCLATLNQCIVAGTAPTTCATQARTCLTAAQAARCDAQKASCTAAGLPANLCDAQRKACAP